MNSLLLRRLLFRAIERHAPGVRDQCQAFAGLRNIISADAKQPDAVEEDARRTKSSSLLADVARRQDVVDLCACSVNRAIDCASARTSVADCCNERSTAVSWTHAPFLRCALSALKQDPAAQLDKRCARAYMQLGDVELNAASAPIHSCWHPRPVAVAAAFSSFWHQVCVFLALAHRSYSGS